MYLKLLAIFVCLATSQMAFGQSVGDSTPEPKDHKKLEGEGKINFGFIGRFLKNISAADGRVRIQYQNLSDFKASDRNETLIGVGVETYLGGRHEWWKDKSSYDDTQVHVTDWLAVPVEFRLTFNADDYKKIDLRDMRVGVARYVNENAPITLQIASVVTKRLPGNYGRFNGIEVGEFTAVGSGPISDGSNVELVFKANVSFSGGYTDLGKDNDAYQKLSEDAGVSPVGHNPVTFMLPVGVSAGVRFYDTAQINGFAGASANWRINGGFHHKDSVRITPGESHFDVEEHKKSYGGQLYHAFAGTGLKLEWKGFVVSGKVQRDWYRNRLNFSETMSEYTKIEGTVTDTRFFEKTTGSHNNDDNGWSGMASIGYDW